MVKKRDAIGFKIKDIILGGQDGLVNILGLVLGVAAAVNDSKIVIISGLAATFAESISMAAVAYTSTKAEKQYYISKSKKYPEEYENPIKSGGIVGLASLIGSLIPLAPFFILDIKSAIVTSLILSISMLFITGAVKARLTIGNWKREGIEMAVIGTLAAIGGYVIGKLLSNL